MRIKHRIYWAFKILFGKVKSVAFFTRVPTEGDTVTVGNMVAIFKEVK